MDIILACWHHVVLRILEKRFPSFCNSPIFFGLEAKKEGNPFFCPRRGRYRGKCFRNGCCPTDEKNASWLVSRGGSTTERSCLKIRGESLDSCCTMCTDAKCKIVQPSMASGTRSNSCEATVQEDENLSLDCPTWVFDVDAAFTRNARPNGTRSSCEMSRPLRPSFYQSKVD